MNEIKMEDLINYCKQYGFIFQGSELYGGLANTWDYGPLGVQLKNNIKNAWRKAFVQTMPHSYEIDAAILMNPQVWVASGHVGHFSDPKLDCKKCKSRYRADNLIEEYGEEGVKPDTMTEEEMSAYIKEHNIKCPKCGALDYTEIRQFNLLFETHRGVVEGDKSIIYLRPENAQGEYVNFTNVLRTTREKLPFGIGQIGKAFRNEITPGMFTFRTIEFEQMEYQWFCKPGTDMEYYEKFKQKGKEFIMSLGIPEDKLRFKDHDKLAHYANAACDIEYLFPFGWGEVNGTHDRTDFDLSNHQEQSGKSQEYLDPETNEKYIPYIVESTYGADRLPLAVLCNSYRKETLEDGSEREVMAFPMHLAPYKACVLPLIKKVHAEKANEIYSLISAEFNCDYDESGNIGKRYRRQDVYGTPLCITIDDETLNNGTVTIRDRDTMKQDVVKVEEINNYIRNRF